MGKNKIEVVADTGAIKRTFENADSETGVGLIIGAVGESQDFFVAHFAETLEEDDAPASSDSGDEDKDGEEVRRRTNFDEVPPATLAFHAKQVTRMLPGGLNILGVYAIDPRDNIFSFTNEPRVKSMMTCVTKGILKSSWYDTASEDLKEKLFIHYNPLTKKFTARIFDCSTLKCKPVDVKPERINWAKLECQFDTVAAMHVPKKDAAAQLKKNLQALMKTFNESLNEAKILINGRFPSTEESYQQLPDALVEVENKVADLESEDLGLEDDNNGPKDSPPSPSKGRGAGDGSNQASSVHILFDREPGILRCDTPVVNDNGSERTPVEDEFINHLHIQGKIAVVAYVPDGSSTAAVATRIRQDIIRSMASRIEMHCESLIDEESTTEPMHNILVHHEIPRRVFVQVPDSSILVSDYLFPGEGPQDSLSSFNEILSIFLEDEGSVLVDKEQPFTNDMQVRGSVEELLAQADTDIKFSVEGFRSRRILFGIIGLIIITLLFTLVIPQLLGTNPSLPKKKEL